MTTHHAEQQALKEEIATLEQKLQDARHRLSITNGECSSTGAAHSINVLATSSLHTLLILADSALPLGSFAFSSGLESYIAHHKAKSAPNGGPSESQYMLFHTFLGLSLQSLASTALPYVLAAHRHPKRLEELDNDFDASTPCTVARRASVAQGRALLSVWDRSFRSHFTTSSPNTSGHDNTISAVKTLQDFSSLLRGSSVNLFPPNAHLAPLWGAITRVLSIPLHSCAYLFLFSHARTVVSAAVRASVFGPYQAQGVLASTELRDKIEALVELYWNREVEDAGQSVPVVDLWVGRHEKLYSRIFNS